MSVWVDVNVPHPKQGNSQPFRGSLLESSKKYLVSIFGHLLGMRDLIKCIRSYIWRVFKSETVSPLDVVLNEYSACVVYVSRLIFKQKLNQSQYIKNEGCRDIGVHKQYLQNKGLQ